MSDRGRSGRRIHASDARAGAARSSSIELRAGQSKSGVGNFQAALDVRFTMSVADEPEVPWMKQQAAREHLAIEASFEPLIERWATAGELQERHRWQRLAERKRWDAVARGGFIEAGYQPFAQRPHT